MTREQELARLAHAIKDGEGRLKIFSQTLDSIQKELETLTLFDKGVTENIRFLKKKKITVSAMEFKNAKEELTKIKVRMAKIRIDRDNVLKANKDIQELLRKSKEEYAKLLKSENNVLTFRRKDAKE